MRWLLCRGLYHKGDRLSKLTFCDYMDGEFETSVDTLDSCADTVWQFIACLELL
jgi:hypothetical protein